MYIHIRVSVCTCVCVNTQNLKIKELQTFPQHKCPVSHHDALCLLLCVASLQPFRSPLLRQYIISCLLNTWRQSQWGNYRGHGHVCTQPPLTDCTSFGVEGRPCCCKGRRPRGSGADWWLAPDMSNMIQQMSLSTGLIKAGICCCCFIRHRTWSCARAWDEGGLSCALNHKGSGIREWGNSHKPTAPAMTCLPLKTGTDSEATLRNLIRKRAAWRNLMSFSKHTVL